MAQRKTATASCLCSSVQFTVSGIDKGSVLCHCSNCQAYSGSAYMHNHRFMESKLEFTGGENLVKEYKDGDTKSRGILSRRFCSNCGSPLYITTPQFPDLIMLHTGTMHGGTESTPRMELFAENRRQWAEPIKKPANAKI